MVKAGLLLALFNGSEGDSMESRSQAHVLIVGDPGLGKSQMLQACSFISPRGKRAVTHVCFYSFSIFIFFHFMLLPFLKK